MKLKHYLISLITFLAIDSLWLGLVAPSFYRSQIGYVMADNPNLFAAGVFYLLFIFGLQVFVIEPNQNNSLINTTLRGALFGLVTYATYDLTNLATLEGWPILLTIVDLAWGTTLTALVTLVSVWWGGSLLSSIRLELKNDAYRF
jgi:uncharacterized membrane protein